STSATSTRSWGSPRGATSRRRWTRRSRASPGPWPRSPHGQILWSRPQRVIGIKGRNLSRGRERLRGEAKEPPAPPAKPGQAFGLLPGSGAQQAIDYTITNVNGGVQSLNAVAATVPADANGSVVGHSGCPASSFSIMTSWAGTDFAPLGEFNSQQSKTGHVV